jgi:Cys-tRNA(Pro)/Cys-tRNA(Cys) deacylase
MTLSNKPAKTNASRYLESLQLPFELKDSGTEDEFLTSKEISKILSLPEEMVYKTILLRGDKTGLLEAMAPADSEIDLKALANLSLNKKVVMTPLKELFPLTGYHRGGCSPLGSKHKYPVFIHEDVILLDKVLFNAGRRGLFILMNPQNLLIATNAQTGSIATHKS